MNKVLCVIDMQNDFVTGSLASAEAKDILPELTEFVSNFNGSIFFTRDTHTEDYLSTYEGKKLPVEHCIKGTEGHLICAPLLPFTSPDNTIDKPTFASIELAKRLYDLNQQNKLSEIVLTGVCTDICVISNAMCIKAFLPEVNIRVISSLCAGTTPQNHEQALAAMKMCQIDVV